MVEVRYEDKPQVQFAPDDHEDEALALAVEASLLDQRRRKRPRETDGQADDCLADDHTAGGDVAPESLGIMRSKKTEAERALKQQLAEDAWDEHDAMDVEEDEMQESVEEADDDHSPSLHLSEDEDEDEGADPRSPSY